jgi:hypothetical protein
MQASWVTQQRQATILYPSQCCSNVQTSLVVYPTGNYLHVDSVYGNDLLAAAAPFSVPFLTITAALAAASAGQTVFIYPGTYNESIVVPAGVSIRGASTASTFIKKTNVTTNTTLVSVSSNSRIEDVTLQLSSNTDGITLIGVDCTSLASLDCKIRTYVLTVTHTGSGATNIYGLRASIAGTTTPSSSNFSRAGTVNVSSSGTGVVRGILVSAAARLSTRDTNVFATGTGSNIGGCETTDAGAVLDFRTSTVSGVLFDISQTLGTILLALSDLINNNANGNGFTVSVSPANTFIGIVGNPANNTTYYCLPSLLPIANISTSTPYPITFIRNTIIFAIYIKWTGTLSGGATVTMTIYKNNSATALTLTLSGSTGSASLLTKSVLFTTTDTMDIRFITSGNVGTGTFTGEYLTY